MRKFEIGKTTYMYSDIWGMTVHWFIVRPLPPLLPNGKYDWRQESKILSEELVGKGSHYDPFFTFPELPPLGRVKACLARYHKYLYSLPLDSFVARDPHVWASKWGWRDIYNQFIPPKKSKHIGLDPTKVIPNRLLHIGDVDLGVIPAAGIVYPTKVGNPITKRHTKLNLYQCTCGRYIATPKNLGTPYRCFSSCGCALPLYSKDAARNGMGRRLDAFREWTTIQLACVDPRCLHYDSKNTADMSYKDFERWYERNVYNRSLNERFVARIDKEKPFTIDNLKIINNVVDKDPLFGYTHL